MGKVGRRTADYEKTRPRSSWFKREEQKKTRGESSSKK
jgi:hypothetical protein